MQLRDILGYRSEVWETRVRVPENKTKAKYTRLSTNVRHDNPRMHTLVTGSYFRPRKKDGFLGIRSAVAVARTLQRCVCYKRRVIGNGIFTSRCDATHGIAKAFLFIRLPLSLPGWLSVCPSVKRVHCNKMK